MRTEVFGRNVWISVTTKEEKLDNGVRVYAGVIRLKCDLRVVTVSAGVCVCCVRLVKYVSAEYIDAGRNKKTEVEKNRNDLFIIFQQNCHSDN